MIGLTIMNPKDFDPNGVGIEGAGIYGLPYTPETAQVVLIPAPWAVTVSYGGGAQNAPRVIYDASPQIDYAHPSYGNDTWKVGVSMLPLDEWDDAYQEGLALRKKAEKHIESISHGNADAVPTQINAACEKFNARIKSTALELIGKRKLVGLIGGDHSTPLGLMQALAEKHEFGILQIDAHNDLKVAYEGFTYSHASIMSNALKIPQVTKLVQVGIRDYSPGDVDTALASNGRIQVFYDAEIKRRLFIGEEFDRTVKKIVSTLPNKVYISFDIDGLDPALCPHTGTPVPGGLQFQEATYLIQAVAESGKTIIGFDLNEVSPSPETEWNQNVGMRVLWNLANWAAKSNDLKPKNI
ncbi:agmatinase family protein [Candidatus Kaiserbacteria bacterium]|nr:agmatinase family protein [Candidatus Kaiserbacteria bacterium]